MATRWGAPPPPRLWRARQGGVMIEVTGTAATPDQLQALAQKAPDSAE